MKNFFTRLKFRHFIRFFLCWKLKNKSTLIQKQVKCFDKSSMICHKAIEIIFKALNTVKIYLRSSAVIKQQFLVIHMMFVKKRNCLTSAHTSLHNREIRIYNFMHLCLYPVYKILGQFHRTFHCKIISISNRIMDHYFVNILLTGYIINRFQQDHSRTSAIGFMTDRILCRHKPDLTV